MSLEDRRTYERFEVELPINCSQEDSQEQHNICAHDISAEGIGVIAYQEFSPGTEVNMSLRLPGVSKELSAQGKVVWSERSGGCFRVGITLEQTGVMEISTIMRFLHAKSA